MTTKRTTYMIRTVSTAVATTAIALILTAHPAQALRPDPQGESTSAGTPATTSATISESGIQPGQVAAGTGAGLLLGAGVSTVILRARRRPGHRPVAA